MVVRVLHVLASLALMMAASHAALPQERYWNAVLPNTRMPKSLVDLLTPDFLNEKNTDVEVGKGGVDVEAGKGKPGGDTSVGVGKGGVHVETGKAKPGGGTDVTVGGGGHDSGGVGVQTGKPGKRTDVGVGKGGVSVHTRHKGRPIYVGVKPDGDPFQYVYAASETQLHDNPNVALFFLEKDLKPGQDKTLRFGTSDGYVGKTVLLPREVAETVPFGLKKFPEILSRFGVKPGSEEANMMKKTMEECEERGIRGEEKYCATSLESMVDFTVSKLGRDNVRVISTEVEKHNGALQKYRISDGGVKKVGEDKGVVCHKQKYPYAVFYCHKTQTTSFYVVALEAVDGTRVKAAAVCHKDTSAWNPNHLAFKALRIKPGTLPVCHFLPEDHVVWFKN